MYATTSRTPERWHGLRKTENIPHANAASAAHAVDAAKAAPNEARSSDTSAA
jgi:hypothetical protein